MHSLPFSTDEKKPEYFDSGFLIVVGEELDSNISEPPTLCISTQKSAILFLMVVGEELGSNISEPRPSAFLHENKQYFSADE
ncbi:hypothetical protein, partial [uncultured Photobacterium sp.]|uniref:hypothetical protein n=1 Tax=uncultured Photobacterium sp. TaxID=173973 RepID=UPI0026092F2D